MLWLYLHFPHLQLDNLHLVPEDTPESKQAIIIVEPRSHIIYQLNRTAKKKHLKVGMNLATAAALCQPLKIVPYQPEFEQQRLIELANWFYHITADIGLFKPNGMVFAVSSMLTLHRGLEAYLDKIKNLLNTQAVTAILALAYSPLAARVLAQSGLAQLSDKPGDIKVQLEQIPIVQLELPIRQQEQLKRIGIDYLSDLNQLPRKEIGARLGLNILEYLDQLYAQRPTSLDTFKPDDYFSQALLLNQEINSTAALLFPLKLLLNKLQQFLHTRARLIQTLFLFLGYRDDTALTVEIASAEPESLCQNWLVLVKLKLETLQLKSTVVSLRLKSGDLLEQGTQSRDLFDETHKQLSPNQLLSRLRAKIGQHSIQLICLHEDYRPEYAFSYRAVSYCDDGYDKDNSKRKNKSGPIPALRPSLLFYDPRPLDEAIRIIHGPERIQSAWWRSDPACRDYFVAKNQRQQTLWVFRDRQQNWFVHGLFA